MVGGRPCWCWAAASEGSRPPTDCAANWTAATGWFWSTGRPTSASRPPTCGSCPGSAAPTRSRGHCNGFSGAASRWLSERSDTSTPTNELSPSRPRPGRRPPCCHAWRRLGHRPGPRPCRPRPHLRHPARRPGTRCRTGPDRARAHRRGHRRPAVQVPSRTVRGCAADRRRVARPRRAGPGGPRGPQRRTGADAGRRTSRGPGCAADHGRPRHRLPASQPDHHR